jgi:hypothetical protein
VDAVRLDEDGDAGGRFGPVVVDGDATENAFGRQIQSDRDEWREQDAANDDQQLSILVIPAKTGIQLFFRQRKKEAGPPLSRG